MEQLEQLRHMRDEARKRIAVTADYKLATSLDALIADLEEVLGASSTEDSDGAEGADDAEAEIAPAAVISAAPEQAEPVEPVAEQTEEVQETVEEAEADDVSDLSRALAEQLEQETATMTSSANAEEELVVPSAEHSNGSSTSSHEDVAEEPGEEDALIRAMRELDEDLANADLADDAKGAK